MSSRRQCVACDKWFTPVPGQTPEGLCLKCLKELDEVKLRVAQIPFLFEASNDIPTMG